jgi:hypothetical protein
MKINILQKINPLCQSGHARLLQLASSSNLAPYILKMNQKSAQGCIITWKMMIPFFFEARDRRGSPYGVYFLLYITKQDPVSGLQRFYGGKK